MTTLHIDLRDGFAGDPVSIRVDGLEVYSKSDVKTDLRISRADGLDVEATHPAATVEVQARGHLASASVDAERTPYLAVDLGPDGHPAIRASAEPFVYL